MSTCQKPMLSAVRAVLCAGMMSTAWMVGATPPTPPAVIEIGRDAELARVQVRDGAFEVPIRIVRGGEVSRLAVHVRVRSTDPLNPAESSDETVRMRDDLAGEMLIRVPLQKRPGTYRIEIELTGAIDDREGILDRKILYQRIGGERPELMLPQQLRRDEQRSRHELFQQRMREAPDRPDVSLLAPRTVKVPPAISDRLTPLSARPKLAVRGNGPSETVRQYTVDRSGKAWGDVDPITVRGRLTYLDFDGNWRPLVNVSVNVFDDDTFGDEHLGTVVTDWSGDWSIAVDNDDGWLQNGRDIYYEFHLGNTRWAVHDDDGDDYLWHSATHDDLDDGTVVDYGVETGSTDATAMQVFAVVNLGWTHITANGGQDPGYIEIKHPTSSSFHSGGVVNIESSDNDGPDTILHEYGHGLMYRAFGNTSISPGGAHGFDDDLQNASLAYAEGWASGFMLSQCPDGEYNWHEGTSEGAGEWPACTSQSDFGRAIERFSDGGNRTGERNEGRVAAAINDFRDSPNDDNGASENRGRNGESDANSGSRIELATIWRDSMWGFSHTDFLDFWFTFAGNLGGAARSLADDIMQYNWMSLPVEISCVASKVVASQSPRAESLLTGLRAFRDQALKPTANGRRWMQAYYSHSPELAMLLVRDSKARSAALRVVEHFSSLGSGFTRREELEKMVDARQAVIPDDVNAAIESIIAVIEDGGSAELRQELPTLRQEIAALRALTLGAVLRRAERDRLRETDKPQMAVRPRALAPASRKADWTQIRRYLPEDAQKTRSSQ